MPTPVAPAVLLDILANEQHPVSKIVVASSMSIYGEGVYECLEHGATARGCGPSEQLLARLGAPLPGCGAGTRAGADPREQAALPDSVYAITKMDQEVLCLRSRRAYGIDATALRTSTSTAPARRCRTRTRRGGDLRLSPAQRPAADHHRGRPAARDFIHVYDVARATVAALHRAKAGGAPSTSAPATRSPSSRSATAGRALGLRTSPPVTGTYRAGDIRHCWADPPWRATSSASSRVPLPRRRGERTGGLGRHQAVTEHGRGPC